MKPSNAMQHTRGMECTAGGGNNNKKGKDKQNTERSVIECVHQVTAMTQTSADEATASLTNSQPHFRNCDGLSKRSQ
jgi:hypothetical protein